MNAHIEYYIFSVRSCDLKPRIADQHQTLLLGNTTMEIDTEGESAAIPIPTPKSFGTEG